MRVNKMDDILMQIYDIKNIEEVWIYDLSSSISVDNRLPIIPSLYVSYDGGKVINLCNKDKYFDVLFKKVREVYSVEKDRIIVSISIYRIIIIINSYIHITIYIF